MNVLFIRAHDTKEAKSHARNYFNKLGCFKFHLGQSYYTPEAGMWMVTYKL